MADTEFIIVGAGGYGSAVAYRLATAGRSVLVLEKDEPAAQASGGAGKRGVRANRRDVRELPLAREAYELWPTLSDELGADTGYERIGGVVLIENTLTGMAGGLNAAKAIAAAQAASGIPTEVWDQDTVRDRVPGVSDAVVAALHCPLDGVAAQAATTRAYLDAAVRAGAVVRTGVTVSEAHSEDADRAGSVTTADGERITASAGVVLAANAGVPGIVERSFGLTLPVWSVFPQVVWLSSDKPLDLPFLTGHDSRVLSIKTDGPETIMLSGGYQGQPDADGNPRLSDAEVEANIAQLRAVFSTLR